MNMCLLKPVCEVFSFVIPQQNECFGGVYWNQLFCLSILFCVSLCVRSSMYLSVYKLLVFIKALVLSNIHFWLCLPVWTIYEIKKKKINSELILIKLKGMLKKAITLEVSWSKVKVLYLQQHGRVVFSLRLEQMKARPRLVRKISNLVLIFTI